MPEKAVTEFWRDLQPITKVFQPDALPEAYIQNAATLDNSSDDISLYVPFNETIFSRLFRISPSQNRWCDILMAKSAVLVNRHYHPHEVFAYTIFGKRAIWSTTGLQPPRDHCENVGLGADYVKALFR
jgi:2,4'-dihydroxyacetophenone dioxygenase